MTMLRMLALGISGPGLLVLAACAHAADDAPPAAAPVTRAEVLARALARAAEAEAAGEQTSAAGSAQARAVSLVDRLGARALDGGEDPVPAWRSAAVHADPVMRGRPLGPGYRSGRIPAGRSESFAQLFLSGTGASITLSAPNGGRVAMRVIDPQAKTVCKGEANRAGTCRWVPLFTQRYTIEVANLGQEDARYFLVVD